MASKPPPKTPLKKHESSFTLESVKIATGSLKQIDRTKMAKSPALRAKNVGRSPMGRTPTKTQNSTLKPGGNKQQTYSKEAEDKFDDVLEGNFTDIPPMPRSTVRIFLSSTFSDMRAERNALARDAYPKLRDYCTELGLTFQVVDLRWGVTAEATNNHMTTKICLLELENCQKVSLGPSCIALIGNRYGFCPLPYEVSVEEYEILKKEATALNLPGVAKMDSWYEKDENAIPPAYYLQPITSQLPNFLSNGPGQESKKQADSDTWSKIEAEMLSVFHKAAVSAYDKKLISAQRKHFYLMSVTEHEARNGIIDSNDPNKRGLVFLRELNGLGPATFENTNASRHKDLTCVDGKLETDQHADQLITSFKKDLSDCLNPDNVRSYTVDWINGGLKPDSNKQHHEYITKFCSDFVKNVKKLINEDKVAKESLIRQREYYSYYSEILHHAHFCQFKCKSFCGQTETLDQMKAYILDPSNRKPFVVYGQSGAGKTSVLAMAMNSLNSWVKENYIGMIRFLGTSPLSTNIYNVLFSICGQLADNGDAIMEPQSYRSMKAMAMYLPRFFRTMATILKQPVIIFLDSLDQLEDFYDAYSAWWLPTNLPANFKLIISTLPTENGILDNLHSVISQKKNFAEVPLLPDSTSKEIVYKYLTSKARTVTEQQMKFVLNTFRKSPNPLYLKLLMDQAVQWNSYQPVSDLHLPDSARAAINHLFEKLEVKFGAKFVQGALGLLTVGLNGLSEIELEDALSCMDDVMIEIYKYHDPPVPGIVCVPPVLWARIRYDIQEYLVERQSQGLTTLYWYHRQFIEVASERFAKGDRGQQLHNTLFEMYAAENGVKKDIILTERKNLHIPGADRNTTPQPMTVTNIRKLECLSYHLQHSVDVHDSDFVKGTTYCNLMFLRAKVGSIGVDKLIQEFENYLQIAKDVEVETVLKFIMTCKSSLKDPVSCAFCVLAFIAASSLHPNLEYLISVSRKYLLHLPRTLLIPTYACLAPRTGEPEKVYDGISHVFCNRNELVLFASKWRNADSGINSESITLACVDMVTTDLAKHLCDQINSEPYITADGKDLFYLSQTEVSLMRVVIESGKIIKVPLKNVISGGGLQPNRLSTFDCMISGSADCKHLVVSVGDKIALLEYPSLKPVGQFDQPSEAQITNLHCCGHSPVTVIVAGTISSADDPSIHGYVTFWDSEKKVIRKMEKTSFEIQSNASTVSLGDEYHICYGNAGDQHIIEIKRIKLVEPLDPLSVQQEIVSMKASHAAQEVFFQLGDTEIHVLNLDTQKFVECLEHGSKIVSFDVAWDEEKMLVADANSQLSLYNKKFEKLMSRSGHFGNVEFVSLFHTNMLVMTGESKVKIWNQKEFFSTGSAHKRIKQVDVGKSLDRQEDIICFVLYEEKDLLITLGKSKVCQVWSLDDTSFLREFKTDLVASKMIMAIGGKVVAYDDQAKKLSILDVNSGSIYCDTLPTNIACFTLTQDKSKIYFLTNASKPVLHLYDIKSNSSNKKLSVNINFKYLSAKIFLTPSERYATFMFEITPDDFKTIAAMWNKGGKLPEQRHPYRFAAVELSQGSGVPSHVYYRLSKVPQLGVTMEPYKGNTMMVSSRRWVMFWDIPTGNCDQTLCKSTRKTKMYRPDYIGQDSTGSNDVITMSNNKEYVAVGSQDGYVFVYGGETGMPPGMKAPSSKHPSPVNIACFNNACTLLASACTGGYLKLWEPNTGNCLFSIPVGTEIRQLDFTIDGTKLVAVTAAERSHILLFDVKEYYG